MKQVKPYQNQENKKSQITRMFDNIAGSYDFLNHFLSMGIDRYWRKKALQALKFNKQSAPFILDVASGTGDFAIAAAKMYPHAKLHGIDISSNMLDVARKKIIKGNFENRISTSIQDAENMNFSADTFDAITIAFGIRNFENLNKGIAEMLRVLKTNGKLIILEFSKPTGFPIKQGFNFYFKYMLPLIGKMFSRDRKAYHYLFESVQHFPDYERLTAVLEKEGLRECSFKPLTFGICTIYIGIK